MKRILLLVAVLMTSTQSFAITGGIAFSLRSSGLEAFPCNAGLRHKNPSATARIGGNGQGPCTNCATGWEMETGSANSSSHVYSSGNTIGNNGVVIPDRLKADWGKFLPTAISNFTSTASSTGKVNVSGTYGSDTFATVFENLSRSIDSKIDGPSGDVHRFLDGSIRGIRVLTKLSFLLASEQYGAEFFVDVCNYMPQLDCPAGNCEALNEGEWPGTWHYTAHLSGTKATGDALDYIAQSGLQYRVETYCDGTFAGQSSASYTPVPSTGLITALEVSDLSNVGALSNILPKKCVTRFFFKETSNNFRLNQTQNACFEVFTNISEPAEASAGDYNTMF